MSVNLSKKYLMLSEVATLLGYPTGLSNHRKTFRLLKAFQKRTGKNILIDLGTDKMPRWYVDQNAINSFLNGQTDNDGGLGLCGDVEMLREEIKRLKIRIENLEMKG